MIQLLNRKGERLGGVILLPRLSRACNDGAFLFIILVRVGCLASMWKEHTYDRLKMQLSKKSCGLPFMNFPNRYPLLSLNNNSLIVWWIMQRHLTLTPRLCIWQALMKLHRHDDVKPFVEDPHWNLTHYKQWLVVATSENSKMALPGYADLGHEFKGGYIPMARHT
ncbi:hypothetical protein L7F22_001752 [Adiantum nelumboides]|nr:hypothetical protein [Adiantum nelumboides]